MEKKDFVFSNTTNFQKEGCFVAILPRGIQNQKELLQAHYEYFNFPGWFGFNWNALNDNLCGLEWIQERKIFLVHKDLPKLNDKEIFDYLDILFDVMNFWEKNGLHSFDVIFPLSAEVKIDQLFPR